MADLVIRPASAPLRGTVPLPGDASIAIRALLLAALAPGESRITLPSPGSAIAPVTAAIRALGATVRDDAGSLRIEGRGLDGLRAPDAPIDCGASPSVMRLLAGLLAGQRFATTLVSSGPPRSMARVAGTLRQRGARIEGHIEPSRVGELLPPLVVGPLPPPHVLSGIEIELPVPAADEKGALLLSGLWSEAATVVREPLVSRDHTERMLSALGVPMSRAGSIVALEPAGFAGELPAFDVIIPGDPGAAAFVLAAGCVVPGSEIGVRGVALNPTRAGFHDVLRRMMAPVSVVTLGDALGEPWGDVSLAHGPLTAAPMAAEATLRGLDEIPAACVVAAVARGVTAIVDATPLRAEEPGRIGALVAMLRAFGVGCEERRDGLVVEGRGDAPLEAAVVDAGGDGRVAMAAAVLALRAGGPSRVRGADGLAAVFPRFAGTLRALGADVRAEG